VPTAGHAALDAESVVRTSRQGAGVSTSRVAAVAGLLPRREGLDRGLAVLGQGGSASWAYSWRL
jgi:hypothetical protein